MESHKQACSLAMAIAASSKRFARSQSALITRAQLRARDFSGLLTSSHRVAQASSRLRFEWSKVIYMRGGGKQLLHRAIEKFSSQTLNNLRLLVTRGEFRKGKRRYGRRFCARRYHLTRGRVYTSRGPNVDWYRSNGDKTGSIKFRKSSYLSY